MFAEENRGKEIKERIQKDLKQYKKAVILTGMILGTMQILFQTGMSYANFIWNSMSRLRFDTCGMVCDYLSMEKGVAVESNNFLMDFLYGKLVFLSLCKSAAK